MNFKDFISTHVTEPDHEDYGVRWWDRLDGTVEGHNVKKNLSEDELFIRSSNAGLHIREFCKRLMSVGASDQVEGAKTAIEFPSTIVICEGPTSGGVGCKLCRIMPLSSFIRYNFNGGPSTPMSEEAIKRIIVAASLSGSDDLWKSILRPGSQIRGSIPVVFWAAIDDLKNELGDYPPLERICDFLGLPEPEETYLELRIKEDDLEEAHVPTGWDGFDHGFFWPQHPDIVTNQVPEYGFTQDLSKNPAKVKGAREVVTKPKFIDYTTPGRIMECI